MARFGRSFPIPRRPLRARVSSGSATGALVGTFSGLAVGTLGKLATGTLTASFTATAAGNGALAATGTLTANFTATAVGGATTHWIFQTPTVADEPPFLPDSTPTEVGLWRHYAPGIRGVTVFRLNNGSYVQDTATSGHTNVNVPYPINFNYPGAPIVETTNWDGTVIRTFINPYVIKQYFGGTENVIDADEVMELTAAGYGPNITPVT